jgi:protein tyrosine phosphatase (PTP) superfamily phosphohydrolase (DUF442 family)
MLNTLKTSRGYLVSLLRKYSPLSAQAETLEDIYNYLPLSETLSTSGQPSEEQFVLIKNAGFKHVINLAPHDAENSIRDEGATLSALGIDYTHIPVNFVKPSEKKFKAFVARMNELEGQKVWLHCAANMRASAFVFRYRTQVLGLNVEKANDDLQRIWQPVGVWRKFISTPNA